MADGLLALIVGAAAIMRLTNLGGRPLSPAEAELAWTVWAFWQPGSDVLLTGSPLYFSLTKLLTQVVGFNDAIMRLVPALFGLGIVLLPWLLRHRLGVIGALVTSLLLAISPLQAITARTVGGDAAAVFAILLLFVSFLRYRETAESRWLFALFAAVGLGLASATLFYSGLFTLGVAWAIDRFLGFFSPETEAGAGENEATNESGYPAVENNQPLNWANLRTAAFFGAGIFLSLSTLFLWNPAGLGAAARVSGDWIAQFGVSNLFNTADPLLALARYEPILLILGVPAILRAVWLNRPLLSLCIYWIVTIFLLILLQRGEMSHAVLLTLPAFLILGLYANDLLAPWRDVYAWAVAGGLLLVMMLILLNLARYLRRAPVEPVESLTNLWIILFALTFALVTIYFVAAWDWRVTYQGVFLALFGFFIFYQWGTGWRLAHVAANDPRERWVSVATDDEIRTLVTVITNVSRQFSNSEHELALVSNVESPALRWYLRQFRHAQLGHTLPSDVDSPAIITIYDTQLILANDYLGGSYFLTRQPVPPVERDSFWISDTLRWWLFRESNAIVPKERIILWLRADLAGG